MRLCLCACALTLCLITFTLLHFKVASGDYAIIKGAVLRSGLKVTVRHCGYDKRQAMWQEGRAAEVKGKPKTT